MKLVVWATRKEVGMHTSILLLILVSIFSILICRNRKQFLENSSVFVVGLFVFQACHDSCLFLVGAIKMFSNFIACLPFECGP
jgi:hypothetical protein